MSEPEAITRLLNRAAGGDQDAVQAVFPLIYAELRRIAHAKRAHEPAGDTLRTTALVHEAYLRLVAKQDLAFNGRHHFYCTAARAMRDLLVEEARRKSRRKRGGGLQRVDLEEIGQTLDTPPEDVIALDDALERLKAEDANDHDVVMLRYFAGLTVEEIAELRGVSTRTIERRWRFCRAWLARELGGEGSRP